jgi:hypothetical protein
MVTVEYCAGYTLPGLGIFVGDPALSDMTLLNMEFPYLLFVLILPILCEQIYCIITTSN